MVSSKVAAASSVRLIKRPACGFSIMEMLLDANTCEPEQRRLAAEGMRKLARLEKPSWRTA
jgi:hypothetical protein